MQIRKQYVPAVVEPLEVRQLLAGVTIITHGYDDNTTGWVLEMANAIAARAGGKAAVSEYTLKVALNSQNQLAVESFLPDAGSPVFGTASSGETVVKLDWSTVSLGVQPTGAVGDVAADWLLQSHGNIPALVQQPIHLIGHSRGASLNTEIAKDLGLHGIWVEQFTSLDPRPTPATDQPMITWSNIVFADDYWRVSPTDISGQPVPGAYLQSLQASVQANPAGPPHQGVHAWYYGTVDLTGTSDSFTLRSSWYGHSAALPSRDKTGFYYSEIVGGPRPAMGLSPSFGGTGSRVDPGTAGVQWADIANISIAGESHVQAGQSILIHFTHEERGGDAQVVMFLDHDRNPYNGNTVRVDGRQNLHQTTAPARAAIKAGTSRVAPGTYYIGLKITTADGTMRYDYARKAVRIS